VLAAVDRGWEGVEADCAASTTGHCAVQRGNEQTTGLDRYDPALAGACVLSTVFPRIECQTNENEHLIRQIEYSIIEYSIIV